MIDYIQLDTLPNTSNHLLNILWDRNHEMTLDELTEAVNAEFSTHWEKAEVKKFAQQLVFKSYAVVKYHGFKKYYMALGADLEWE